MITLFTIPKPFAGHIGVIQRNAIRSWLALRAQLPQLRIMLLGDETGTAQFAQAHQLDHQVAIARSPRGTPLLHSLFACAEQHSSHQTLCYINADILLMSDFARAVRQVLSQKSRYLMVGQRTDFDLREELDFTSDWEPSLRERVQTQGKLHRPTGIDYFLYRRGLWGQLPPFAVGRFSWDNWMIYRARQLHAAVIDATPAVLAVHQNHDYAHAGGFKQAKSGAEARFNYQLAGGQSHFYTIWDSTHLLHADGSLTLRQSTGLGGGIWSYRRSAMYGAG